MKNKNNINKGAEMDRVYDLTEYDLTAEEIEKEIEKALEKLWEDCSTYEEKEV